MKILVRDRDTKKPYDKKLAVEDSRITLQLSDGTEYELYEVKDSSPSRSGKGLVIVATSDMKQIIVKPEVTNSIVLDVER